MALTKVLFELAEHFTYYILVQPTWKKGLVTLKLRLQHMLDAIYFKTFLHWQFSTIKFLIVLTSTGLAWQPSSYCSVSY